MDDTDTKSIDLARGEARHIVAALSEYETTATGTEEESIVSLRKRFEEEFDLGRKGKGDPDRTDGTPTSTGTGPG